MAKKRRRYGMRLTLVIPDETHAEAVMEYRREFLEYGESMDGTGGLRKYDEYDGWLARIRDNMREETVRAGLVPATQLLALDEGGRLVGMIDVRHRLNEFLLSFGGNIGYSVRRSERRKGYASQMLRLALEECRALRLTRVLVTCDSENVASRRTILGAGGVLENELPEDGRITQRYWIEL